MREYSLSAYTYCDYLVYCDDAVFFISAYPRVLVAPTYTTRCLCLQSGLAKASSPREKIKKDFIRHICGSEVCTAQVAGQARELYRLLPRTKKSDVIVVAAVLIDSVPQVVVATHKYNGLNVVTALVGNQRIPCWMNREAKVHRKHHDTCAYLFSVPHHHSQRLCVACQDGVVRMAYRYAAYRETELLTFSTEGVQSTIVLKQGEELLDFDVSPDGTLLLASVGKYGARGALRLHEARLFRIINPTQIVLLHSYAIPCGYVAFASDGLTFALGVSESETIQRVTKVVIMDVDV